MNISDLNPSRWLAYGAVALAVLGFVFFQGMRHQQGLDALDREADQRASEVRREANRSRATDASLGFQADKKAFDQRAAAQPTQKVKDALLQPICPIAAASAPLTLPSFQLAPPLRLSDVPVPRALIDELRSAGSEPGPR